MATIELHVKDDAPLRHPVWGVDSIFGSGAQSETSSDGFSTSCGSELGFTITETESDVTGGGGEEEEEDFIAELTRQMADYMLRDDDDGGGGEKPILPQEKPSNGSSICYYDNRGLFESGSAVQPSFMLNDSIRPIEVYKLQNQPSVVEQGIQIASRGRRSKKAGSTRRRKARTESQPDPKDRAQQPSSKKSPRMGGEKVNPVENGSGMQAILIGGSGLRNKSHTVGTGVFLPRVINQHPTETVKKSGCSTALVPVRVLQALQLHFNQTEAAVSQSNACIPSTPSPIPYRNPVFDGRKKGFILSQGERRKTGDTHLLPTKEMSSHEDQLPQEWIY
ncbi:unnamed protein product [Cuscuta epithymum]|uniref:Uncharacterized protein n=1 Tax=Cuscuta epithymum TaxID=186058 RepID=A0AAV0DWP1_9ASTE|nr:unnamed protein product [Cuscuta epithymum]